MAFRDVSKALSWAYMMQEKAIIDAPGYCASMRGTNNDLLIGLNAQEAMQQSADIIRKEFLMVHQLGQITYYLLYVTCFLPQHKLYNPHVPNE